MTRHVLSVFFGICATALGLSSTAALAEKKVALIIGNSAYQNVSVLPNPANDAAAMAKLFRSADFKVFERQDLSDKEFRRSIREFALEASSAEVAIVFYAGHGIEIRNTNYLIPVDAKLVSDVDARDEAVSLDRILEAVEPARRLRLVILDACRDNPFEKKIRRSYASRSVARGLAEINTGNTLVAYASKAGSTADDGSGAHSPFTTALLKHLAEPGLDLGFALRKVRDDVLQATGYQQEPFLYGSLGGSEISIFPKVASVAPVV